MITVFYWFAVITTYDQVMFKLFFKNEKLKIFATLQNKIGRKEKKTKQMEKNSNKLSH